MAARVLMVCWTMIYLCAAGCTVVRMKGEPLLTENADRIDWPFMPVAMRLHPFTAVEFDEINQQVVLDARVELLDRVGDMTKGVGKFRLEMYSASTRASSSRVQDELLYVWNVEMLTLAENQQYYDPITRTYAFRLKMDHVPPPGTRVRLFGQFTDTIGQRLEDSSNLVIGRADRDQPDAGE